MYPTVRIIPTRGEKKNLIYNNHGTNIRNPASKEVREDISYQQLTSCGDTYDHICYLAKQYETAEESIQMKQK